MYKKRVYIIGAGASNEVNLPTGEELKKTVTSLLNIRYKPPFCDSLESGDRIIAKTLPLLLKENAEEGKDINFLLKSAWHIRDNLHLSISIDNFIDSHRGNKFVPILGKLAIARAILEAERQSHLAIDNTIKQGNNIFPKLNMEERCWLFSFFQILNENCSIDKLEERLSSITFIVFNYDRCIEQYLFHTIKCFYDLSESATYEYFKKINIFHPYGSVGELPFSQSQSSIHFGEENLSPERLISIANGIKTFTEESDPNSSDIHAMKKYLESADILVFLGFAFHNLNMEILKLKKAKNTSAKQCYATAKGLSSNSVEFIKSQFEKTWFPTNILPPIINMSDTTCDGLFCEYRKGLAF